MLRYKAEWEGIRVIEVNPAHTSQICPRCGKKDGKARQGNRFCCTKCHFQHNADFVAAYNIAVRALKKLGMREEIGWKVLTGKPRCYNDDGSWGAGSPWAACPPKGGWRAEPVCL